MEIVSTTRYEVSLAGKADVAGWMDRWTALTATAAWSSLIDVRRTFPTADGVTLDSGTVVTVFNARGNKYRLLTTIIYPTGTVTLIELLTHAEYDREKWKNL